MGECFHWREDLEIGFVGHIGTTVADVSLRCKACGMEFLYKFVKVCE